MWEDAVQAVKQSTPESRVYIGCDSICFKKNKQWFAKYTTVVVVHMDSRRGCKIFYNNITLPDYRNLKARLMTEAQHALEAADVITDVLGDRPLEVHLDLNNDPKHKSNIAVAEAVGWVRGMGFTPVIKPMSWAATHAADHCVRSKTFAR